MHSFEIYPYTYKYIYIYIYPFKASLLKICGNCIFESLNHDETVFQKKIPSK